VLHGSSAPDYHAGEGRPLTLFDIAVPRDVEAQVDHMDNVYLFNVDHLQAFVADSHRARSAEVAQAHEVIAAAVAEYLRWLRSLEIAPTIVAVRAQLDGVRLAELARLRTRLPGLSDPEWKAIEAAMQSLTNKIAHPAIQAIKSSTHTDAAPAALEAIRRAFGLSEAAGDAEESRVSNPLSETKQEGGTT
jgi:glutamyl-tRNA reductase